MKSICLFLLSLSSLSISAQTKLSGKVVDKNTKQPLADATVVFPGISKTTLTDKNGLFTLTAGTNKAAISYVGYNTVSIDSFYNNMSIELEKGNLDLNEIIVHSGQNVNPLNTISKIDIASQPVRSSQDVLRVVPGLFIGQHQGGGKAEQIFLRGFDIDHGTDIQLRVDGMPVNMVSHAHGQGYADLHFLIPELIENADYGKGPYSTRHGNFSTAGYVDFETKKTLQNSLYKIEAGQFNTLRAVALTDLLSKNQKKKGTSAYIANEFLYSDGPFDSPINFNRFNITGRFNTKLSAKTGLSFTASLFNSKWYASGQIPERAVNAGLITRFGAIDNTEGGYTGRANANLHLNTQLNEVTSFENQFYYSRYHFNLHSNFTFFLNDPVNGDQIRQREHRDIFGYNATLVSKKYAGLFDKTFTAGYGFRFDKTNNSELSKTINRNQVLKYNQLGNVDELNAFAFADKTFTNNKWSINVGARLDYFYFGYHDKLSNAALKKIKKPVLSPKFNVQYSISKNTQLYFKAGKSFHSNDSRVVLQNGADEVLPAAYGVDAGVTFKPIPSLIINAAAWHLYLQQEFVYVGDEGIVEPSGKTKRSGVDISARYQYNKWLFADVNINLAKPRSIEEAKGNDYIPLAPTFTSTGGISTKFKNGIGASLRYRYMNDRAANEDKSVIASGYFVTDLNIGFTKNKFETGIVIENLFNTKWKETQFNTNSILQNEPIAVEEIHYTPGTPFFARVRVAVGL